LPIFTPPPIKIINFPLLFRYVIIINYVNNKSLISGASFICHYQARHRPLLQQMRICVSFSFAPQLVCENGPFFSAAQNIFLRQMSEKPVCSSQKKKAQKPVMLSFLY